MKKSFLIFFFFVHVVSLAQVGDTLYLDSLHIEVGSVQEAKYIRSVVSYDASIDRFRVVDRNVNGVKVFEGQMRFVNAAAADGEYLYYFDTGSLRLRGKNGGYGKSEFEEELWHPNGSKQGNTSEKDRVFKIHNFYDSLGNQEVRAGNGKCRFVSYFYREIQEGMVINGTKEGAWMIYDLEGKPFAKEYYRKSSFVKGYKLRDADSVFYRTRGELGPPSVINKIQKNIKRQIRAQVKKRLGQRREIGYAVYVRGGRIVGVQLLRDKFVTDHQIHVTISPPKKRFYVLDRDEFVKEYKFSSVFKMSL